VIAFGVAVTSPATYDRYALPGIERVAETDSLVMAHQTAGSIFHNYNLLLDKAGAHDDLEALVLPHQDTEIVDPEFLASVREALADPDVAVIGCAGAVGVRGPAWWQGAVTWASMSHRYDEYGGGEFPGMSWTPDRTPSHAGPGEVDSVDGFIMVLSAWAVRNLRFDESLGKLHGYDFDICMQARAAGKKVVTANFKAVHHRRLELLSDPEAWIAAYIASVEKWESRLPDPGGDPERRALRAEAEAACARVMSASEAYRRVAIERQLKRVERRRDQSRTQLAGLQRELESTNAKLEAADRELERERARLREVVESASWRLTAPLRALRRGFRRRR
jgi:Glycosyltransferase like family